MFINRYNLEPVWYSAFKKTIGENSELGVRLSNAEAGIVINSLTDEAAKANLSRFLHRWNNTGMLSPLSNRCSYLN